MKTIIRVGDVIDTATAATDRKFSTFALRALTESFSARRDEFSEALLFVEPGKDGKPVYVTVGSQPPELLNGDRQVHAVFVPADSQEPVATFYERAAADVWAAQFPDAVIRLIDSTDRLGVQASVAVIVRRGDEALYCRTTSGRRWTLPEGRIEVGESIEAAGRRAVRSLLGLELTDVRMPANVPYVNTYLEAAAQHFLTCVLTANAPTGTPAINDPHNVIDHFAWFPIAHPPGPLFPTVAGIIRILKSIQATPEATPEPKAKPKPKARRATR